MHLDVTPEGLVAAEAQVTALTARLSAQSAVQASAGSLVAPPARIRCRSKRLRYC